MILCSMAIRNKMIFSQNSVEFNNIIITVKDSCLDTRNTHHTHAFLCLERTTDKTKVKEFHF
jgi:hypothetical protein